MINLDNTATSRTTLVSDGPNRNSKVEIMEGMDIVLTVLITFTFVGFTTIGVIKGITNYRLRKRMIEAGLLMKKQWSCSKMEQKKAIIARSNGDLYSSSEELLLS